MMFSSFNFDLISVGIAVAANVIMGFIIFFQNPKNATNVLFLFQTLILSIWSTVNYLSYLVVQPDIALLFVRLVLFFAVPNSIIFLLLMHTFPEPKLRLSSGKLTYIFILMGLTMIATLTPFVFAGINFIPGSAPQPIVRPGILLFMVTAVFSIFVALYFLIRRYRNAPSDEKSQLRFLLIGVASMFGLILVFDFILPVVFGNTHFIALSAVFTLPFVGFTAFSIAKHNLFHVKVLATEILTFVLAIVTLFEALLSESLGAIILRSGIFLLILSFGILLIKSVIREVRQREKLEVLTKELEAANEKLQAADQMKSQFLSFASHQVKSPMTVVKDYADLIKDGSYGEVPDKVKETATKIHDSADRLIELVNNLLDLRKLDEGKVEYRFEKMDLSALVKNIFTDMKTLSDAKGLEMTLESPTEPIMVNGDTEKLRQVIQNLVDNSIKYTEKGYVKMKIQSSNSKCQVTVSDSGLGIPQDLTSKIFEQFNRGSKEAKKIQGTGLGLYIAQRFITAHDGGRVWAQSDGVGKGSTFTFEMKTV